MKYAGIINNDVVNGRGVCVSFWTQGCPHRCPGCHNPSTWSFDGGIDEDDDVVIDHVIEMLHKNDVHRNLSILGGEPLCNTNMDFTYKLISKVKDAYPDISIFVWTGYTLEELLHATYSMFGEPEKSTMKGILKSIDILVDGRFEKSHRDITLPLCGSTNQRVIDMPKTIKSGSVVLYA